MMKMFAAGALLILVALVLGSGCLVDGGDICSGSDCSATTVPTTVPATPEPKVTDLSRLSLTRADAPFTVADEKFEEKSPDSSDNTLSGYRFTRGYQAGFADKKSAPSRALVQMILEFPEGEAARFYEFYYQEVRTNTPHGTTVTLLADPGIGDRSMAFRTTYGEGTSSGSVATSIIFTRNNIVEMILIGTQGPSAGTDTDAAALTAIARKAESLIPASGTKAPAGTVTARPTTRATRSPVTVVTQVPDTRTCAAAATGPAPSKVDGMLVWYNFEDDFLCAGKVIDTSGNGRDGVVTGTVATAPGIGGSKGIRFTGKGYLLAPDNPAAGQKAVTFSFWFKTADPSQNYKFASAAVWRGGPGTGWTMATHRPEFWADDGPEDLLVPGQPNADNAFVPGSWTHEAVVYDGKTMKEYTNGKLINTWEARGQPMSQGVAMAVGGWPQFSGYNYVGEMDDFRIYDHALRASEIQALSSSP